MASRSRGRATCPASAKPTTWMDALRAVKRLNSTAELDMAHPLGGRFGIRCRACHVRSADAAAIGTRSLVDEGEVDHVLRGQGAGVRHDRNRIDPDVVRTVETRVRGRADPSNHGNHAQCRATRKQADLSHVKSPLSASSPRRLIRRRARDYTHGGARSVSVLTERCDFSPDRRSEGRALYFEGL